ncbi:hypothetical protein M3Y94_00083400 [Aphelenchoides besseyi]|nr:hypothetical protein M3Y94_00083400 [Aphelenchoides besseyi]
MSTSNEVDVYDDRPYTHDEFREWWNSTCTWYIGVAMERLKDTIDQTQKMKLSASCVRLNRIRQSLKLPTQKTSIQQKDVAVEPLDQKIEQPTTSIVDHLPTPKQPVNVEGSRFKASSPAQSSAPQTFVIPKLKLNDNQTEEREEKKADLHSKHQTASRRSRSRSPKKPSVVNNKHEEVFGFRRSHRSRSPEPKSRSRSPRPIDKRKTRTCQNWKNGHCKNGNDCRFAHFDIQRSANPCPTKFKTVVCNRIKGTGYCHFGSSCWFIHPDDNNNNDRDKHAPQRR